MSLRHATLPDRHHLRLRLPRHHCPDVIADPLIRLPDPIVGQMGVAFRRRDLGMTKELANLLER